MRYSFLQEKRLHFCLPCRKITKKSASGGVFAGGKQTSKKIRKI
jgi:hypothetical protein